MRRIMLTVLLLLLMLPAAHADETWTEATPDGDVITYTQVDTDWGYVLYNETDDWMVNFRHGSCIFASCNEYVSVHDEMTGLQTFYRAEWPSYATPEEAAILAQTVPAAPVAFVYDLDREKLVILGVGETDMPGMSSAIHDAYDLGQRLFLTFTNFEGQHYLRIVTWADGLDVRTIEMPWSGLFDTYHMSRQPEDNDHFVLRLDAGEAFGYITVHETHGRWLLTELNTGREVISFAPWPDIETMDWGSLPFPKAETQPSN